jgi:hypothetical protein
MSGNGIDVQNIDFGLYAGLFEPVTRRFTFPDDIERLMTLDSRYWRAYDVLRTAWVRAGDIEQASFELALEDCKQGSANFEERIRQLFQSMIRTGWSMYSVGERPISNDKYPST